MTHHPFPPASAPRPLDVAWVLRAMPLALCAVLFLGLVVGPAVAGYRVLSVLSGSMAPALPTGSLIVSRPVPATELRVGDVITYRTPDGQDVVVTHRVVEVVKAGAEPLVRTRGDANEAADPWVARLTGGTVWRTTLVIPFAGTVAAALRGQGLRLLGLYAGCALFAWAALRRIWAQGRDRTPAEVLVAAPVAASAPAGALVPAVALVPAWAPRWQGPVLVPAWPAPTQGGRNVRVAPSLSCLAHFALR